ncbi:MAG: EF-P lysine aminoacylase EpmA [Pirellula sp.]|nr:EF-P lysine aminoacylase EpmA [Pirellula sp.]
MRSDFQSQATPEILLERARVLRLVRHFFDDRGFVEVQTPVLCREAVIDRHLDPIPVAMRLPGSEPKTWYLQTSPEQSMKRLLASGLSSIYQIGPVFREGELGRHHNPEFTMLEWYEIGAGYEAGQRLLCDLVEQRLGVGGTAKMTFERAFFQGTGLSLYESSVADLGRFAVERNLVTSSDWSADWDDWVNLLFSECVQATLGLEGPVLITNFPASQAALAEISASDPRTAERYELFYRGIELANGYHELLDANVLRERDRVANAARIQDGKSALPECSKLLAAMEFGIPPCSGCALGFDRLVMLACKVATINEVVSFTAERA